MENKGEFVDQSNVEIALGIFDDLCGFSDANAARAEDACGDRCATKSKVAASLPLTTLRTLSMVCSLSQGLMRSRL